MPGPAVPHRSPVARTTGQAAIGAPLHVLVAEKMQGRINVSTGPAWLGPRRDPDERRGWASMCKGPGRGRVSVVAWR